MNESNYTPLLEELLDYARTIGKPGNTFLSAERFLVASIMLVDGSYVPQCSDSSREVVQIISNARIDLASAKQKLLEHIRQDDGPSLTDELYMKKKLSTAQEMLPSAHTRDGKITPRQLLNLILTEPSPVVEACMFQTESELIISSEGHAIQVDALHEKLRQRFAQVNGQQETFGSSDLLMSLKQRNRLQELTQQVKQIQASLSEKVYGQDQAISTFTSGYFQAELLAMTDPDRVRPRATYLFAGPPGVGKTYLAESAAALLDLPFRRFDMSEYSDKEASIEFCGSDKVYKNGKPGNVTSFLSQHPKSVVLFDEIEKAHISVIHLFLQILDAGRIRDNYTDMEIPLKDVIMIFTTNAGRQLYDRSENSNLSGLSRKVILQALKRDTNPATGAPSFPAAICSRFASGNVVMFNRLSAHDLHNVAKREITGYVENFRREMGIDIRVDEEVYTALLLAEGGAADARTIRSRAGMFLDGELLELLRLMEVNDSIHKLQKIQIRVELPQGEAQIRSLFVPEQKPAALLFSSPNTMALCGEGSDCCELCHTDDLTQAEIILQRQNIQLALLELEPAPRELLNIADAQSPARDLLRLIRQEYPQLPVLLLQPAQTPIDAEDKLSFLRQGVRDVLEPAAKDYNEKLRAVCLQLHRQQSMHKLERANQILTFETAQRLTHNGHAAQITLYDLALITAVDAEDTGNILSHLSRPDITFDQIIGAEDAKEELQYFVDYLKDPQKYRRSGVSVPKGVLLYGPSGTGKTMLAKAMAGQSQVTFLRAEGNQFLESLVGAGAQKVHDLFRVARKYAPAILFVDEIDAIGKERRGDRNGAEETLTAFFTEMDGFQKNDTKPVFVLAATNFDIKPGHSRSLDPALVRRFDRQVYIDLPGRQDRLCYLRQQTADETHYALSDAKCSELAVRSAGMSLAQLAAVLELALRMRIRNQAERVTDVLLEEAFETYRNGQKKTWDTAQLERVARHEAGHVLLCRHGGELPAYVTVVARGDHGGYMQQETEEDKALYTRRELLARIRTALGGRAAELVCYGQEDGLSTGASGDLDQATELAQQLVCIYGMDEILGLAVIDREAARTGELAGQVRQAVNRILFQEQEKAEALLRENRDTLDRLTAALLEKNHLTRSQLRELLG